MNCNRGTLLLLLSAFGLLSGCYTVPQTGRSTLHLVPSQQLASMAAAQFGQLKQATPVSQDPAYNAMLTRVGERIAYAVGSDLPNAQWEFVVFDDESQINAFARPGGKVAVYSGIFKVARTDADLAVVVGHEIAHVVAGHGNERMTQQLIAAGGALYIQYGTKSLTNQERDMLLLAYGAGTTVGLLLPYSRLHETEADKIGLLYLAKAGYDPQVALGFWERMEAQQQQGNAPPEFLSTHPSDATRMRKLREYMPLAMQAYRNR
jgi:predicted Zn-dependent protease